MGGWWSRCRIHGGVFEIDGRDARARGMRVGVGCVLFSFRFLLQGPYLRRPTSTPEARRRACAPWSTAADGWDAFARGSYASVCIRGAVYGVQGLGGVCMRTEGARQDAL
jgi:hypothetical protein